jgi:hypothetical protein
MRPDCGLEGRGLPFSPPGFRNQEAVAKGAPHRQPLTAVRGRVYPWRSPRVDRSRRAEHGG